VQEHLNRQSTHREGDDTLVHLARWKRNTTCSSLEGDVPGGSGELFGTKPGFEYWETLEETLVYSFPWNPKGWKNQN